MSVFMLVALAGRESRGGQAEFVDPGVTTSWVVPAGVTSIHAVVVDGTSRQNMQSYIKRGGTYLMLANMPTGENFGGSNGGAVITGAGADNSGGGGAGGYSGSGGGGHDGQSGTFGDGSPGTGGGGGGGASGATPAERQDGGGVYLHGEGPSGAGGKRSPSTAPGAGSDLNEGSPVGAGRKSLGPADQARPGGNLRYTKTPIAVTPGETLTIYVGTRPPSGGATTGGGVRIIWGEGRSYPNNAKDV